MATTTTITKMLFRRGNDSDRQQTILASGEPGWALDTKRLWIGDGVTPGGYPALSAADQHLRYVNAAGQIGAGPQKLDINIHGLSATLVGDGEYDRSLHGVDRTINTDYPLQFSTISQTEAAIYYNGTAESEFFINRTNGGTINIGNALFVDIDPSGNGSIRFTADETTFEAAKLVFAESDTTVYEDRSIDLNVNVNNQVITPPGTGGTSEKTGLYLAHKNYLSAGHMSVGHTGDVTGWSTIELQPPVYESDWTNGETELVARLDRPSNTTSSWIAGGAMTVGSGLSACKPLVFKSARPDQYSGDADLVFETGLIVYGEGDDDIGGWNGYLMNQSVDTGAKPRFAGLTIEKADGSPGDPIPVRGGGTGVNQLAAGGVLLANETDSEGPVRSMVLQPGEIVTGSNTGSKVTQLATNSWLNVTADATTGAISIINRMAPTASFVDDSTTQTDYINKWYNIATNTGNMSPPTNKSPIEIIGDGASRGATDASDVNISTSNVIGDKLLINHKLHAATLFDDNVTGGDLLATVGSSTPGEAITSITFNKAGHVSNIVVEDLGGKFLSLDHVGTNPTNPSGTLLSPADFNGNDNTTPSNGPAGLITQQSSTHHVDVVTGIDFNDYGTIKGTNTWNLRDNYYNKHEIGTYVSGLNGDINDLDTRLTNAAFFKTDASSTTKGTASITTSWLYGSKVQFGSAGSASSQLYRSSSGNLTVTDPTSIRIYSPTMYVYGTSGNSDTKMAISTGVTLYYNNVSRLSTTSSGVTINGGATATTFHGNGNALVLDNNSSLDAKYLAIEGSPSDQSLKDNKQQLTESLDKVNQLTGYEFDWNDKASSVGNEGHDIGLIAQEVEDVVPEVVGVTKTTGVKTVRYDKLVPLLIESIKTLTSRVETLESQLKNK